MLDSAFRLAYFILRNKDAAEAVATEAVARLSVAVVAQDRRYYYVPGGGAKAVGARTKITLGELHLLQRLVYDETESYERAQEESPSAADELLLSHFIKHLVRITLKRNSFYVTLGISRLLHRYATAEAVELYGLVVQNPNRVKDNHYWRSRKAQLIEEMKTRFGDLIALTRSAYGEERFAARDNSSLYAPFVKDCLTTLMPWGTACPLPQGAGPVAGPIPPLDFRGTDPDEEHQVEIARIHAVMHPDCFARLIAGLQLDAPDLRLEVPQFFRTPNHYTNESMPNHGIQNSDMSLPDLDAMRTKLNEQEQLLRRARPQRIRLLVDRQERGTLDLRASGQVNFTLAEGDEFIELRTPAEEGDIRLALYPVDYQRLERSQGADEFTLMLADGRKLEFSLDPQRDLNGEITGATARAAYQAPERRGWRQSLASIFTPSAPAFSYALAAALIAIGLTSGLLIWQALQTDSSSPTVAVNKPTTSGNPNAGALNDATPSIPDSPPARTNASPPSRTQNGTSGAGPSGVTRDPDVNTAADVKSLSQMKQIFISVSGDTTQAQALREQISRQLQATGRWTEAAQDDADVALNVSINSGGHTASFQLVNASGQIIWPAKGKWRTYSGDAGEIARQMVNELLKAAR